MIVSATEFKSNMGYYLEAVRKEDLIITRNGKYVARLTDANRDKSDIVDALRGILPAESAQKRAKEGRLAKYESRV